MLASDQSEFMTLDTYKRVTELANIRLRSAWQRVQVKEATKRKIEEIKQNEKAQLEHISLLEKAQMRTIKMIERVQKDLDSGAYNPGDIDEHSQEVPINPPKRARKSGPSGKMVVKNLVKKPMLPDPEWS
tara:strand:+ start:5262 stop:5651 length:390 start_codon:yes stop_codon:yes gene_type:complete